MIWPILRRVGVAVAVSGAALSAVAAPLPSGSAGRPWLAALDRFALAGLVIGALLQMAVPKPSFVWLASVTTLTIGGLTSAGRPGNLEFLGAIAVVFATPLLLLLSVKLSIPSGRAHAFIVATSIIAALGVVRVLVYEPFADVNCPGLCRHNPILLATNLHLAHDLGIVAAGAVIVVAGSTALCAIRWLRTIRQADSRGGPAQFCVAAAALVLAVDSAARLISNKVVVPSDTTVGVLAVELVATILLSGALILTALRPIRARRNVHKVARLLARTDAMADVQAIFRKGFGDPSLLVGYWVEGVGYLDQAGESVGIDSFESRIDITARGLPVAVIAHQRDALSSQLLAQQLGSQARLAIHNESLTFQLNRHAAEVARSRRRIVEVGDAERRRLERDLHDGAQQRLLALSFELRRGERAAVAALDSCSAARFNSANALAQIALEQLRHLAHGIYPATLNGAGLHDALLEFAASRGRPLSITVDVTDPIPVSVESTVYKVLTEAIDSSDTEQTPLVAVRRVGDQISLAIDCISAFPQHAVDRAEAVGGRCARTPLGYEVVLPCAW
jgi:signal transduction histidine kinase